MGTKFPELTAEERAEIDNADDAAAELGEHGRTDRRCLRCGGELRLEQLGSGYRVWCTQENRELVSVRGL